MWHVREMINAIAPSSASVSVAIHRHRNRSTSDIGSHDDGKSGKNLYSNPDSAIDATNIALGHAPGSNVFRMDDGLSITEPRSIRFYIKEYIMNLLKKIMAFSEWAWYAILVFSALTLLVNFVSSQDEMKSYVAGLEQRIVKVENMLSGKSAGIKK